MPTQTKFILFLVLVVIIIGVLAFVTEKKPEKLDAFAQCIDDSGAEFYGTFWCSHCQNQKEMFGQSKKYLPYIECSTPDGQGQLEICKEAGIEGYPTWVFADGSRLSGELSFEILAEKTNCKLPQ